MKLTGFVRGAALGLCLVGAGQGSGLMAAEQPTARDLAIVQKPIAQLAPVKTSPLRIRAWVDRADQTYAVGERVTISVQPNQSAYITVINVGTSGMATILFPNNLSSNNFVRAGQTLTLPPRRASWAVQAQGPGGVEVIKVIASREPISIWTLVKTREAGPFRSLESDSEAAARDLALVLNDPTVPNWSETTNFIRVVPFR